MKRTISENETLRDGLYREEYLFSAKRVRETLPEDTLSLHVHVTRGLGLANLLAGYEEGVTIFDVCAGSLGGCPFVKDAAGNVPAEDAVHMFEAVGISTGIDLRKICDVVEELQSILGRKLPGRMIRLMKASRMHS